MRAEAVESGGRPGRAASCRRRTDVTVGRGTDVVTLSDGDNTRRHCSYESCV